MIEEELQAWFIFVCFWVTKTDPDAARKGLTEAWGIAEKGRSVS